MILVIPAESSASYLAPGLVITSMDMIKVDRQLPQSVGQITSHHSRGLFIDKYFDIAITPYLYISIHVDTQRWHFPEYVCSRASCVRDIFFGIVHQPITSILDQRSLTRYGYFAKRFTFCSLSG